MNDESDEYASLLHGTMVASISAQSLCSLRLSGYSAAEPAHHRDAEHAEDTQRIEVRTTTVMISRLRLT